MVARSRDGARWYGTTSLTPPGDHFRVALGEDARGRIWCVYSAQKRAGKRQLRSLRAAVRRLRVVERRAPHQQPAARTSFTAWPRTAKVISTWSGWATGGRRRARSCMRVFSGDRWGEEINVSQSPENDWEPAVAVDRIRTRLGGVGLVPLRRGGGPATYDVMLRGYSAAGLGAGAHGFGDAVRRNARRRSGGYSRTASGWRGKKAGINWGKDTGYENPRTGSACGRAGRTSTALRTPRTALYRRPRVAVLEGGQWKQPQARLEAAYPESCAKEPVPEPAAGTGRRRAASGCSLRHQLIAQGRNGGQMFDYFATTLKARRRRNTGWRPCCCRAAPAGRTPCWPRRRRGAGSGGGGGGRRPPFPRAPAGQSRCGDDAVSAHGIARRAEPEWTPFQPSLPGHVPSRTRKKRSKWSRFAITASRWADAPTRSSAATYTGTPRSAWTAGIDGSLWDLYRYAIDAAEHGLHRGDRPQLRRVAGHRRAGIPEYGQMNSSGGARRNRRTCSMCRGDSCRSTATSARSTFPWGIATSCTCAGACSATGCRSCTFPSGRN